jgi:glycosyltransferase involved in cell wall biosynthesis
LPAPPDVLILASGLGIGGTERHLARLAPALVEAGLDVAIWNSGEGGQAEDCLGAAGVEVSRFPAPVSLREAGRLKAFVAALVALRPGVVHSFLYGRHWLDALACRLSGVPYVSSRRNLSHWRTGSVLLRERWRDHASAAIVANSAAAAAVARGEGADASLLCVIPNGVPLPPWTDADREAARLRARAELDLPAACRAVGSVGSLKAIKDPMTLLAGFARRLHPDPEDRLVLVGAGPLAGELREAAAAQGLRLVLTGAHAEPERLLPAFDLFALASRSEGCSNALLEAKAAGLAVVASDVGGNRDLITPGQDGWLVPAADPAAWGERLGMLLAAPQERARLGRAAREQAERRHSIRRMVDAHVDLYARLAGRSGGWRHAA